MDEQTQQTLFSSDSGEWETPGDLFMELDNEFDFVLDAAATEQNTKCPDFISPEEDALKQSWQAGGAVWLNPPYGRGIDKWVKKSWEESQKGSIVVVLLPARTDTKWFHEFVYGRAEIRFIKGRIRFLDGERRARCPAPFPSMLAIYRPPHLKRGLV
jgi:site-specific DNA-methyltransferase (adenine-specific)